MTRALTLHFACIWLAISFALFMIAESQTGVAPEIEAAAVRIMQERTR